MRNILFFSLIFVNTTSCGELSETICQLTWMINQIMTSIGTIVLLASAYVNINNIHLFKQNLCKWESHRSQGELITEVVRPGFKFRLFFRVQSQIAVWSLKRIRHSASMCNRPYHGFDAILTGRQSGQKLEYLYGNPMANNIFLNGILHNSWIAMLKY